MTDVIPSEAQEIWNTLSRPSCRGVWRSLNAAGRKVSLQTIANWKAAGWSRKQVPLSAMDQFERVLPAITGKPGVSLNEHLASHPERRQLLALTPQEIEAARIHHSAVAEIVLAQTLQKPVKDSRSHADMARALASLNTANTGTSKQAAAQAPEQAKVVGEVERDENGFALDDPLRADFAHMAEIQRTRPWERHDPPPKKK